MVSKESKLSLVRRLTNKSTVSPAHISVKKVSSRRHLPQVSAHNDVVRMVLFSLPIENFSTGAWGRGDAKGRSL
ncbi:unnamed protein product [Rotaria socialis]|uniref:Uncharacterized protein n=1 Tax=Rotaria socialis TaxID=392032 RepID=A0A821GMJ7_9BILA|nr:unnamed protein product [Rotaria socialis]